MLSESRISFFGAYALRQIKALGEYAHLWRDILQDVFTAGIPFRELVRQTIKIGLNSLPIIALTAVFTGMVLAIQTAYGLHRFGAKNYVGNIVGLSLVRELGPVLTALMLCGRVGAGVTAEIASMVVTEQVDAMRALGANPIRKLVTPRVIAGLLVVPLLVIFADTIGIYGGRLIAVYELNLSAHQYYRSLLYTVLIRDIFDGLIKSAVFGAVVVSIACYKGLKAHGGTEGVGEATTASVVTASLAVLVLDFFLTKLLIRIW